MTTSRLIEADTAAHELELVSPAQRGKGRQTIHAVATVPQRVIARDEMNLAEFPLTVLSTRASPGIKTLEFNDVVWGKNGETINRAWIITGADKFGLPTASDDEVLLGLIKLTVDDGFQSRKVYFTRYELLRILRWTTEGRSYVRLQRALDRLSGVRIKATNAFFDNENKAHSTRNFGLIDGYEINDGRSGPVAQSPKPSFFTWSDVLFKSFQVGFIKKLDLDFFLGLRSAVSKRLYRYLDKHFWYRNKVQQNLFTLAHEKIGISRNYRFASSLRQQLDPAVEELIERGFLSGCSYEGKGSDVQVTFLAAAAKPRVVEAKERAGAREESFRNRKASDGGGARDRNISMLAGDSEAKEGAQGKPENFVRPNLSVEGGEALRAELLEALTSRGLREMQVTSLLAGISEELLQKMKRIVGHYDGLRATGSSLISRSPVGFLYRAIEKAETFVLPGDGAATARPSVAKQSSLQFSEQPDQAKRAQRAKASLEAEFLVARKRDIQKLRGEVEEKVLLGIRREVETALSKVKSLISASRFGEVVEHGVDEKLAKLFALPEFGEWVKLRG